MRRMYVLTFSLFLTPIIFNQLYLSFYQSSISSSDVNHLYFCSYNPKILSLSTNKRLLKKNEIFLKFIIFQIQILLVQSLGVLHSQIQIFKKKKPSMNSYQTTTDSQSESESRKYEFHLEKTTSLRRTSRRIKRNRISKIQNSSSKIQIQDPFPQAKNFNQEVRTYAKDIMKHVSNTQLDSIITQNYMQWQTDINSHMREILVGWLIQVSSGLNLRPQTLHLAVLLVDKYCYARSILKKKYQVLGGACLYIAAKYEEIVTPRLKKYVDISDKAYTAAQLLYMQSEVLLTLNFKIQQKSTLTFYEIKSEEYGVPKSVLGLGYFLLQMCLVEFEFCRKKPIELSLAVLYTAMKLKKSKICPLMTKKVFSSENFLDDELFSKYVSYIESLFSIRYLPKFSPVRKRYGVLFTHDGELK